MVTRLPALLLAVPALALDVPFTVTERGNVSRTNWPITSGAPLAVADNVTSGAALGLYASDGTTCVPHKITATGRWGGHVNETTKPIKWVLVEAQASPAASGSVTLRLKDAPCTPANPTLSVANNANDVTVNTGAASFVLDKTTFSLFKSVTVGGNTVVADSGTKGIYVVESATTYRSTGAPAVTVESSGPMRAQVKFTGTLSSGGNNRLQYIVRMYFYAGRSNVKTFTTIVWDRDHFAFKPSDLGLTLPINVGASFNFRAMAQNLAMTASDNAYLLQEDWNSYRISKNAASQETGSQSDGWADVSDATAGVTVFKRWAWQEYPLELEAAGKQLNVHFWPIHADIPALVAAKESAALQDSNIQQTWPYQQSNLLDLTGASEYSRTVAATGATRLGNVVTVTLTSSHIASNHGGYTTGRKVYITGASGCSTSINGVHTITSVPTNSSFTFSQTGPNETCGNGTARSFVNSIHNVYGTAKTWEIDFDFHSGAGTGAANYAKSATYPLHLFDATQFATSGALGYMNPRSSGLPANDTIKQSDDLIDGVIARARALNAERKNYGWLIYGDDNYDLTATINRFWMMYRHDWNASWPPHYARTGNWDAFDFGEASNRHIMDVDMQHVTASFTSANGQSVNKEAGAVNDTHEVGNAHFHNLAETEYMFPDDPSLGAEYYYYLTGNDRLKDVIIERADLLAAHPPGGNRLSAVRMLSNLNTGLAAYRFTGSSTYLNWLNTVISKALNEPYMGPGTLGYIHGEDSTTMPGWSVFLMSWAMTSLEEYWEVTGSTAIRDILVRSGRSFMKMGRTIDAGYGNSSGFHDWAGFGICLGAVAHRITGEDQIAQALRSELAGWIAETRLLTVTTSANSYMQSSPQLAMCMPRAMRQLQSEGNYQALLPSYNHVFWVPLVAGVPQTFYVNETVNGTQTVTFALEPITSIFSPWARATADVTITAFNPSGTQVAQVTRTPAQIPITNPEIEDSGGDDRMVSITIPSDGVTGIYRLEVYTSANSGTLQTGTQAAFLSSTTGNGVWWAPDGATSANVTKGVLWFNVPSGATQFKVGGSGGTRGPSLLQPDGTVIPYTASSQTKNVVNQSGKWAAIQRWDASSYEKYPVRVRSATVKPLFAARPDWWFDVPAIATQDTTDPSIATTVNLSETGLYISTTSLPDGTVGVSYAHTLTASGGSSPYTWSVVSGSLPAGLAVTASTGLISGTPTASGTSNFTVRVQDSVGASSQQPLSIDVASASTPLSITTSALPDGVAGQPYSTTMEAAGGASPYTWSLVGGNLCSGLNLSSGGVISGNPPVAQTCNMTIRVTDSSMPVSQSEEADFSLVIASGSSLLGGTAQAVSSKAIIRYGYAGLPAQTTCTTTVFVEVGGQQVFSQTDAGGRSSRHLVATGLLPATTHVVQVDCGGQFWSALLPTPGVASGTRSLDIQARPPGALGAQTLQVDYGLSEGSLSSSASAPCATGCTVVLPNLNIDAVYFLRRSWKDGGGAVLQTSAIHPVIP